MLRGLMVTNAMLSTESKSDNFEFALDTIGNYDIKVIEYYTPDAKLALNYGNQIKERGYKSIYHSAIEMKRSGWCRLCAANEAVRHKSLEFTKKSIDRAIRAKADRVVIQSGRAPEITENEGLCLEALTKSVRSLMNFAGDDIEIAMEPCDRSVDVKQLIGPAMETYTWLEHLNESKFSLTMDTAHIALSFEEPIESIKLLKKYSNHIHLANSCLRHGDELFGDKHPLFNYANGTIDDSKAQKLLAEIEALYDDDKNAIISTEMICREEDERQFFVKMIDSMPWFFRRIA